ncbi:hypothetical protein QO003_000645 [Arthrobacter silviterrae]|uniref:DUF6504 family protein n=1 Tax=Arthrobacter TaxID=1663 RepID=UPI001F0F3B22|nr:MULTISPECIES: DUF6504 family protein [Arthrobacter]MDQ0276342.1 hypothetical protein [Arthrobacter silviterrae]
MDRPAVPEVAGFFAVWTEVAAWVGTFSDSVEVSLSTAGVPLHLLWQGRRYTLAAEPLCWYQRRNWWDEETRAARGDGIGLVDRQIWRVQVHRDGAPAGAALTTFDLVRYQPGERWRIIKVHDAVVELAEGQDFSA